MRKSYITWLFFCIYTFAISGIAVSIHYCGDEISSIKFTAAKSKTCGCSGEESAKSCCKDEIKQFKNDPAKASSLGFKWPKFQQPAAVFGQFYTKDFLSASNKDFSPVDFSPHKSSKVPLYLMCRTLII